MLRGEESPLKRDAESPWKMVDGIVAVF
jgi:hypothetical protein